MYWYLCLYTIWCSQSQTGELPIRNENRTDIACLQFWGVPGNSITFTWDIRCKFLHTGNESVFTFVVDEFLLEQNCELETGFQMGVRWHPLPDLVQLDPCGVFLLEHEFPRVEAVPGRGIVRKINLGLLLLLRRIHAVMLMLTEGGRTVPSCWRLNISF